MPADGRAQLENRITRGTRTISAPLHPVAAAAEPAMDVPRATDTSGDDQTDTSTPQPATTPATAAAPAPQHLSPRNIPPQGTAFSGPATQPLYIRVHPEISDWIEGTVTDLRPHRTSRAEVIEMLLWEQRDTPSDHLAERLRAFRWETGRR